ncbi:unnamed protein product [Chondrus crispus]|uniref:Uncharacterized protein n=1 Tax=Chondrus crispus TaxID=2769 RepID=R7QMH5_CHOCR|nr:unnamed protein product [Chondrus crispus]CDF38681.1 unnamed protein product [Chondrus crispus]|eukprot:XP_005718586.1 unnamed protein product [Chondrus crispus]
MPTVFLRRRSLRMSSAVAAVPIPFLVRNRTRPLRRRDALAVIIPGDSVLESTTIGGTVTFFNIYQNVIVARILLSWFPGVQSNPIVRPLITVCDPYLNLFRQTVPPIFGLDLSPILALLLLQAFGSVSHAVYLLLSWGLFAFDDEEQLTERTDFKNDCMDTGYDCPWCRSRQPESGVPQQEEALHNAKVAAT